MSPIRNAVYRYVCIYISIKLLVYTCVITLRLLTFIEVYFDCKGKYVLSVAKAINNCAMHVQILYDKYIYTGIFL